jgi:hypothetical protein
MKSFSERKGLKPIKSIIQVDSMDDDLRNSLWNALSIYNWDIVKPLRRFPSKSDFGYLSKQKVVRVLVKLLWRDYFKKSIDALENNWDNVPSQIRDYFFGCPWNEVYDFIQFVANNYPDQSVNLEFISSCNFVLNRELSAYRFVGGRILPITSEVEIDEIEEALKEAPNTVAIHLKTSLNLLSDRKSPDYRNSIKESISAVESISKLIADTPKGELDQALKELEKRTKLHPALKKAFVSLYGYTSNTQGIRHALMDEPNLDFEDAKFMLVSCSAFVNYLIVKASNSGIKI